MKVFFTSTPRLNIKYNQNMTAIFNAIEELGHKLTNDYLRRVNVKDFYKFNKQGAPIYYDEILDGVKKADIVIFETSLRSMGVGHLLEKSLDMGKAVVALHMESKFPFYLGGIKNKKFIIEEYNLKNIKKVLKYALDYIKNQMDERFTLLLPPKIVNFLNEVANKQKIHRSVFIRKLIEKEIEKRK